MLGHARERGDAYQADRFLTASDLDDKAENAAENADWKTVVLDEASGGTRRAERVSGPPLRRAG